ncbi:MAG: hypothetical protein A3D31_18490 [Candidatus Fluviicola riflensis]|nr:MAG: hypothetical protein CHH17_03670 [Candidatus Fluviicola riflensis]OGS76438.1 MAG: hypothetical protein A3D31_18490 [Candidatus Fluviicola riflensis]OGS82732.1 MAG: hypothetical protein A2724_13315 [Fluviicola sp. RIFCSPHIGHO2_01_FULL_43_53]OGS89031.1 MAG: hypothetical protein A3E30_16975 [Fluviicola sp. RIFCSPHIGHO2_12_FULL_43_24]
MRTVFFIYCWLFAASSVFSQRPDSVQVNGKWYFVYPIKMKLEPTDNYLRVVGLTETEFEQYRDWTQAGDSRLNLEKDSLIKVLRKSIVDDKILTAAQYDELLEEYSEKQIHRHRTFIRTTKRHSIRRKLRNAVRGSHRYQSTKVFSVKRLVNRKDLRKALLKSPSNQHRTQFYSNYMLPPSEKDLPNGNYILYFDDFFSADDWKEWKLNPLHTAATFSLQNNLLHGEYSVFTYEGSQLVSGTYENGLRQGSWLIRREIGSGIDYREGWCFNRKYKPGTTSKDSLLLQFNYDLLQGENSSFSHYGYGSYVKDWTGEFIAGLPNGEWEHDKFRGYTFRGDVKATRDSTNSVYEHRWVDLELPSSDSIYDFSGFTDYNDIDLWSLKSAKCVENSGLESISKISDYPLSEFMQLQFPVKTEFSYSPFNNRCEIWNKEPDSSCVARFYRNHALKIVVGSRYFNNGVLFDTCGFDEQGQLVYKQFDNTGKLYRTSQLSSNGRILSTVFTHPPKKMIIDGYEVMPSYSKGFSWEGDTLVANRRIFELKWSEHYKLNFENYYDKDLQQFVEKSYDNKTGETLLTITTPFTNEELAVIDSTYQDENQRYSKAYVLRSRRHMAKIDAYEKRAVWGDLTILEEYSHGQRKVTFFADGKPYAGTVEVKTYSDGSDRYKLKRKKLVIELNQSYPFGGRKHIIRRPRWMRSRIPYVLSDAILEELPLLFQLKIHERDEFKQSVENSFPYEFSSGNFINGVPTGNWTFMNNDKKVTAEVTYTGKASSGFLFEYWIRAADTKAEKLEYLTDPLKERYEPACKKSTDYIYKKIAIANGREDGTAVTFNHKGDTIALVHYKQGELHGDQCYIFPHDYYSEKANKYLIGTFDEGKPVGKQIAVKKEYTSEEGGGKLVVDTMAVVHFVNGKREGRARFPYKTLSYDLTFSNDLPDREMVVKNNRSETVQRFTFMFGYLHQMQHFKENTLSYEYEISPLDSLKLDIGYLYDATEPVDEDNTYNWESRGFADEFIKRDETPKQAVFTKFYPNGTIARSGELMKEKKLGRWTYASEDQSSWYTIDYKDSIYVQNGDTFSIIGVQTQLNVDGKRLKKQLVLEEKDFYKCTSDEYYSIREYIVPEFSASGEDALNYYDNGALMSKGKLTNGLPDGLWQFYNQQGGLTRMGIYKNGKKIGRWLEGDLTTKAYLGDICLDESNPDLDVIISQLERGKKIEATIYRNGKPVSKQTYESSK